MVAPVCTPIASSTLEKGRPFNFRLLMQYAGFHCGWLVGCVFHFWFCFLVYVFLIDNGISSIFLCLLVILKYFCCYGV